MSEVHWLSVAEVAERLLVEKDSYQPAYRPSSPGRLHELGLGAQGCPRSLKMAAFSFPGVINYDLSAALAASLLAAIDLYNAAIEEAIRSGRFKAGDIPVQVDAQWLRDYITNPARGSSWLAQRLQVPRDVAKELFYAIMFGGSIRGAVTDVLAEHYQGDQEQIAVALRRVRRTLCWKQKNGHASLLQILDRVDELIFSHAARDGIFRSPRIVAMITCLKINRTRHGTSAVNAIGRTLPVMDPQGVRVVRDDGVRTAERHLRCHLTQGIEQEFIASVVVELLKEHAVIQGLIHIMSQQHDGFVIWASMAVEAANQIVQRCVERARPSCVLGQLARLENKPIG